MIETSTLPFQQRLRTQYGDLSPAQAQVAEHFLDDFNSAVFSTIDQLAGRIGVSPSTIVRFAISLGYSGFSEMQDELRNLVKEALQPAERLANLPNEGESVIQGALQKSEANIRELINSLSEQDIATFVDLIDSADRVFIKGGRSSFAVASFFGLILSQIRPRVLAITQQEEVVPEILASVGPGDLLVAISFPRYTSSTIRIGKFFRKKNAGIALITDSIRSPLAPLCSALISVPYQSISFFNSNVAAFALVDTILASLAIRRRDEVGQNLKATEDIWQFFEIHQFAAGKRSDRG